MGKSVSFRTLYPPGLPMSTPLTSMLSRKAKPVKSGSLPVPSSKMIEMVWIVAPGAIGGKSLTGIARIDSDSVPSCGRRIWSSRAVGATSQEVKAVAGPDVESRSARTAMPVCADVEAELGQCNSFDLACTPISHHS